MGEDALAFLNALEFPLARPLERAPGELQQLTPTIEALVVPDIDASLDEQPAKTRLLERLQGRRPLVGRAPSVLSARARGDRRAARRTDRVLPARRPLVGRPSLWWDVAWLDLVLMPAVFALVWLVLPLRGARAGDRRRRSRFAALAAVLRSIVGIHVLANFAKLFAMTFLALWFLAFFESLSWVVLVAAIIPFVDAYSVCTGPTKEITTNHVVAAGIAHEIRNPLVGIGSTTALLLDDAAPDDPRRADLEIIFREIHRLDRIVNQIVDYARPRSLAPVWFSLSDVVHEGLKLLETIFEEKHLVVTCRLSSGLPPLQADRDQVKQVFLNVVQNAIEASQEKGTISILTTELARGNEAGIGTRVTDQGCGIAADDLFHVFEPFFTLGKRRGTGLGLAICRNIIESHAGDISVTSEVGKGTSVNIWLPLRQPQLG